MRFTRKRLLATSLGVLLLLLGLAYGIYRLQGGAAGLVLRALPDWPDWPAPSSTLPPDAQGQIYFATQTPFDFDVLLAKGLESRAATGVGTLILPESASAASPVPAVVLLHGSGGIQPGRERRYGRMLAGNGYAAFVVNYYAPRGVTDSTPYMLRVLSITEFDALSDAYAALRLLATDPAIDARRIAVAGFSYGGMAARFALDDRIRERLAGETSGFAAHIDYYGPCFQDLATPRTTGAPLLTLRGDQDASNDLAACVRRERALRRAGSAVEAHVLLGAGHAWEVDSPRQLHADAPYVSGCEVVYDAEGHSSYAGRPVANAPRGTSRAERIALRVGSGAILKDCVHSGYVIGRDDTTRAKTDHLLLDFLSRTLGR